MGRIGSVLSGTERRLLNQLREYQTQSALASFRLATEKRINYPRDNPSGFLALSLFQTRLNGVRSTITNVTAASSRVTQAQTVLSQIRTQLNTVRTELLTDESRTLTPDQRAAAQARIDAAIDQVDSLAGTAIDGSPMLDGSAAFTLVGRNPSQIHDLTVYAAGSPRPIVAMEKAQLTYTGTDRFAASNATITLTGNLGSASISVTTNDPLEAVAAAINNKTADTGVTASVRDNTLTLESQTTGNSALVRVRVDAGTFVVHGGEGSGVAYGAAGTIGTTPSLMGRVVESATQAELKYTGSGGVTTAAATFSLSGERGSAAIAVSNGETLAAVAQKINNVSHRTGVTATVDGDDLQFTSVDYGSKASAAIQVTSGTFALSGGNGDGTANGTDVVAEINGATYQGSTVAAPAELRHREKTSDIANDATISVTGNLGSASFTIDTVAHQNDTLATLAAAITAQSATTGVTASVEDNDLVLRSTTRGDAARVTVATLSGTFKLVDGSSSATAYGSDATQGNAAVNGNQVQIGSDGFRARVEFTSGFEGSFDSVSVEGGALQFQLSTSLAHLATLAIPSILPSHLGGDSGTLDQIATGGTYSGMDANTSRAIRIVDEALGKLDLADGSVDGFYNSTITTSTSLLDQLQTDLEDSIAQTDGFNQDEEEQLLLDYSQRMANTVSGLAILNEQRTMMVDMIKRIAGLLS